MRFRPSLARTAVGRSPSLDYRNPAQLRKGGVLVAGAGNSGAEIAIEAARDHETWLSGRDTGHVPFATEGLASRLFLSSLVLGFVFHHVLTVKTPIGRKLRPKVISRGAPLIRLKPSGIAAAGVKRVPKIVGARDGLPVLDDGRVLDVANVVWCTDSATVWAGSTCPSSTMRANRATKAASWRLNRGCTSWDSTFFTPFRRQ